MATLNMNSINKYKGYMVIVFTIFLFTIVSYILNTGILLGISGFLFDFESYKSAALESGYQINSNSLSEFFKYSMEYPVARFLDYNMIFSFQYMILIIPIFGAIAGYIFYKQYNTILKVTIYKSKQFKKILLKTVFKNAFSIALSVYIAYLLFFTLLLVISNGLNSAVYNNQVATYSDFLLDFLGSNFYQLHPIIYHVVDGFIKFFLYIILYSLFAQALVLVFTNKLYIIFLPIIFYYTLNIISFVLAASGFDYYYYLSPSTIVAHTDFNEINSVLLLGIAFIPLSLITSAIISYRLKYVEL